jgi:superfamily II DNA/RNA helicase
MLDMGFSDDILQIAKHLPEKHQTIMFSATMPEKIRQLAKTLLQDPVEIRLAVSRPADKIHQMAYICYEAQKIGIIKELFKEKKPERVIIFTGSKVKAKDLAISLTRSKFNCRAMHSDLSQQERDEVMYLFRSAQTDILVATDIVARGIDIDDITLVINFDVPHDAEDYVHRIGRTARAGAGGSAITLVSEKDQPEFNKIEHFLGKEVEKMPIPELLGQGPEYVGKATGNKFAKSKPGRRTGKGKGQNKSQGQRQGHSKNQGQGQGQGEARNTENAKPNGEKREKTKHRKTAHKKNHDKTKAQTTETQNGSPQK